MNLPGQPLLPSGLGDAEEKFLLDMFGSISSRLKTQYHYSDAEFFRLWNEHQISVPAAIFAGKLSPAEAIAKYLKENCQLSYHDIATRLGRDERSIWCNHQRAQKKMPWPLQADSTITLPLSAFSHDRSILESAVLYLKDVKQLRNAKIAQVLGKQASNIWTIHRRARGKGKNNDQ